MSAQQVSNMLKGKWHPSIATIERIAEHFGIGAWVLVRAAEEGQSLHSLSMAQQVTALIP